LQDPVRTDPVAELAKFLADLDKKPFELNLARVRAEHPARSDRRP